MNSVKTVLVAIGALVVVVGIGFVLQVVSVKEKGYFAPQYEEIRRQTQVESRAFTEATQREFYRLKREYEASTTDAQRQSIRAMLQHEADGINRAVLPLDLQQFLAQIGA